MLARGFPRNYAPSFIPHKTAPHPWSSAFCILHLAPTGTGTVPYTSCLHIQKYSGAVWEHLEWIIEQTATKMPYRVWWWTLSLYTYIVLETDLEVKWLHKFKWKPRNCSLQEDVCSPSRRQAPRPSFLSEWWRGIFDEASWWLLCLFWMCSLPICSRPPMA